MIMPSRCIDDNMLVAYADGELDPALNEQIEAAIATDRQLQARVAIVRQSDTSLKAAFEGLELPAPSPALKRLTSRMMFRSRFRTMSPWALPIAAAIFGFVAGSIDLPGYFRGATYTGASVQAPRIERVLEDIVDDQV